MNQFVNLHNLFLSLYKQLLDNYTYKYITLYIYIYICRVKSSLHVVDTGFWTIDPPTIVL